MQVEVSMKMVLLLLIVFSITTIFSIEDETSILVPHYQTYNDSIWFPNTTAYDFKPIYNYNGYDYLALYGGIGKLNQDSLYVIPYPAYGNYKQSVKSFIKVNNKIWIAVQHKGIFVFDLGRNHFENKIIIKNEVVSEFPYSNIELHIDNNTNIIWISTFSNVYKYDINNELIDNVTSEVTKLVGSGLYSHTPILIDDTGVWFLINKSPGCVIYYNNFDGTWKSYHDELVQNNPTSDFHIFQAILSTNYLWLNVNDHEKFSHVVEFDKTFSTWNQYEIMEIPNMLGQLINALPKIKVFSHTSRTFPIGVLENYIQIYHKKQKSPSVYAMFDKYYLSFDEEKIQKAIKMLYSVKYVELLISIFHSFDYHNSFLHNNKIFELDEHGTNFDLNSYIARLIDYNHLVSIYNTELLFISDKGLNILNIETNEIHQIKGSNEVDFSKGESQTKLLKIDNKIYILYITYGHDTKYYLYEYNHIIKTFLEITPEFDFSYKQEYFWKKNNELFMLRRQNLDVFRFTDNKWIQTGLNYYSIKDKKFFQKLPKRIELINGRIIKIDNSGMKIYNND